MVNDMAPLQSFLKEKLVKKEQEKEVELSLRHVPPIKARPHYWKFRAKLVRFKNAKNFVL